MVALARLAAAGFAAALAGTGAVAAENDTVARGKYLVSIMDCTGCHSGGALMGRPDPARFLGGSEVGFEVPGLGVFYPPNLTPDRETGLGAWTADEIVTAIRTGARPDGRILAPIMPWRAYATLSDEDARAVAAYLQSLPPVKFQAPAPAGSSEKPTAPYLSVVMPK